MSITSSYDETVPGNGSFENREILCLPRSNIAVHSNSDNRSVLCANCKTDNAHRSHRHGVLESCMSMFAYYPYSCTKCKHRFLRRRDRASDAPQPANRSTEREIRATRNARKWRRKRVEFVIYGTALLLFVVVLYFITRARSAPDAGRVSVCRTCSPVQARPKPFLTVWLSAPLMFHDGRRRNVIG